MVIINFFFGILVFKEPVADVWGTVCSFILLIVGLVGMSHYSSPEQSHHEEIVDSEEEEPPEPAQNYQTLRVTEDEEQESIDDDDNEVEENDIFLVLFNGHVSLTKRQCGILGAVMNGVMTGGSLIPLHYAAEEGFGGAKYFPSMGVGAMIANTIMWILLYIVCLYKAFANGKPAQSALHDLPKWHFRVLWLPALSAGLMLSLAMFSTILAITYLGQGVGNSIVQSKILVSGLWGIFWYKEVVGTKTVAKWFASAGICMIAIIWLSLERLEAKKQQQ